MLPPLPTAAPHTHRHTAPRTFARSPFAWNTLLPSVCRTCSLASFKSLPVGPFFTLLCNMAVPLTFTLGLLPYFTLFPPQPLVSSNTQTVYLSVCQSAPPEGRFHESRDFCLYHSPWQPQCLHSARDSVITC